MSGTAGIKATIMSALLSFQKRAFSRLTHCWGEKGHTQKFVFIFNYFWRYGACDKPIIVNKMSRMALRPFVKKTCGRHWLLPTGVGPFQFYEFGEEEGKESRKPYPFNKVCWL